MNVYSFSLVCVETIEAAMCLNMSTDSYRFISIWAFPQLQALLQLQVDF